MITEFDDYIQANPLILGEYRDVSKLPFPKAALIRAFQLELAFEQREEVRAFLSSIGLLLTNFRDGIGSVDLRPITHSLTEVQAMNDAEYVAMFSKDPAAFERYRELQDEAHYELQRLSELFQQSMQLAMSRKP